MSHVEIDPSDQAVSLHRCLAAWVAMATHPDHGETTMDLHRYYHLDGWMDLEFQVVPVDQTQRKVLGTLMVLEEMEDEILAETVNPASEAAAQKGTEGGRTESPGE